MLQLFPTGRMTAPTRLSCRWRRGPDRPTCRRATRCRMAPGPGSPYMPTGNPMLDGVGPASYADREDVPELSMDNIPAIVPLRADTTIFIAPRDTATRVMTC